MLVRPLPDGALCMPGTRFREPAPHWKPQMLRCGSRRLHWRQTGQLKLSWNAFARCLPCYPTVYSLLQKNPSLDDTTASGPTVVRKLASRCMHNAGAEECWCVAHTRACIHAPQVFYYSPSLVMGDKTGCRVLPPERPGPPLAVSTTACARRRRRATASSRWCAATPPWPRAWRRARR